MATPELKSLPPQARKRIEKLETTVSELTGALGQLVSEMRRQGMDFPVENASSPLLKTLFQRDRPHRTPRKVPSFAPVKATKQAATPATGLAAAVARGEAARVEWVSSGEVVPARTLADKWGLTPQALGPAADRGEVFAVVVKRQRFYPKEFLDLHRDDVATVSKALGNLSPEEKLVFWKRPHGALGGKTVFHLLSGTTDGRQLMRLVQLAQAWAVQTHTESDVAEAT
jgi:hypothetical protein